MGRFIEGSERRQRLLLPDCIDDYVGADSAVRVVDLFVDELDLAGLGFDGAAATGRPGYHPATMLKLYIYGYLNQVQSSRRLEREAGRNVELMWLTGKLAPDFKTIADFRRDHGAAIQAACRRFVLLCRQLGLIAGGTVAIDGSRLRAVNARDRNFTPVTIRRRMEQVDASIVRYLGMLNTADRQEGEASELRTTRLTTRLGELRRQMRELEAMEEAVMASPDRQISLTDPDARAMATASKGTGWLVTTCKRRSIPTAISSSRTRSSTSAMIARRWRAWANKRARRPARPSSPCSPTVVTSQAWRCWLAKQPASRRSAPSRSLRAPRLTDASASRTSSISPTATPTAARQAKR